MSDVISGGSGQNGKVSVLGKDGQPQAELLAFDNESVIGVGQRDKRPGRLTMFNGQGQRTVNLRAEAADLHLGGGSGSGLLTMGKEGPPTVFLSGFSSTLQLGGSPEHARISLLGTDRQPIIEMLSLPNESVIGLGQRGGRPGRISLFDGNGVEAFRIDAASGATTFNNADCAEEFDLVEPGVEPGTVMVLTDEGSLAPSEKPYDTRVAGVVSGAGSLRPALILDRRDTGTERAPIALVGKVYSRVDATDGPVRVGDLLTTAERKGHAMRIADPRRAFGAVLGKALAPLKSGCDLIPILVALQ